jgi:hypothetical protein
LKYIWHYNDHILHLPYWMHKLNSCAEIHLTKTVIPFSVCHLELLSIEWHNYKYHTLKMTLYSGSKCQTQLLSEVCFYSLLACCICPHIRWLSFLCGRERRGTRQRRGRHSPFLWAEVRISPRYMYYIWSGICYFTYAPSDGRSTSQRARTSLCWWGGDNRGCRSIFFNVTTIYLNCEWACSPMVRRSSGTLPTRIYRRYALSGKRRSRRRRGANGDFGNFQMYRSSVLRRCS